MRRFLSQYGRRFPKKNEDLTFSGKFENGPAGELSKGEPEKQEARVQNVMTDVFASETSTKPIEVKMHKEEFSDAIATTKMMVTNSATSLGGM